MFHDIWNTENAFSRYFFPSIVAITSDLTVYNGEDKVVKNCNVIAYNPLIFICSLMVINMWFLCENYIFLFVYRLAKHKLQFQVYSL